MLLTILIVVLVFMLLGALPTWPHSQGWGPYPSGVFGIILVLVVIWLLFGGGSVHLHRW